MIYACVFLQGICAFTRTVQFKESHFLGYLDLGHCTKRCFEKGIGALSMTQFVKIARRELYGTMPSTTFTLVRLFSVEHVSTFVWSWSSMIQNDPLLCQEQLSDGLYLWSCVEKGSYCMVFVSFRMMWWAYLVVVVDIDMIRYVICIFACIALPESIVDMLYSTLHLLYRNDYVWTATSTHAHLPLPPNSYAQYTLKYVRMFRLRFHFRSVCSSLLTTFLLYYCQFRVGTLALFDCQ